jgi:hypothetical protein
VLGELFRVLVEFGLVVGDAFLQVLFLLDQVLALGLDIIDLVFLLFNDLLISLLQVLNSFLQQLIFVKQLLVLFLLNLHWLGLFGQFIVFLLQFV